MNPYLLIFYILLKGFLYTPSIQAQSLALLKAPPLKQSLAHNFNIRPEQSQNDTNQIKVMSLLNINEVSKSFKSKANEAANVNLKLGNTFTDTGKELISKIKYYRQACALFRKAGNTEQQAATLQAIAQMHHQQGNHRIAIEELEQTLSLYRSIDHYFLHHTYALLSGVYKTLGNYPEALRYGLAALENSLHTQDTSYLSIYHLQLGYLYHDLKQPDEALHSCEKALQHIQKQRRDADVYNILSLAVNVLLEEQKAKDALLYIEKITIATPPGSLKSVAMVTLFKTQCYIALKQYLLAKKYILLAEQHLTEIEKSKDPVFYNDSYKMGVYQVAGELYMAMQEYAKSRHYFNKMVQVNEKVNYLSEAVLHQLLLFKLDSAQGNFKSALRHHQHYSFLKDSIFNEAKSKQIASLQIQNETQAKVQRIELLTKKNEIQQAMLKQKDFQQTVFIIGSLLLLLLLILVYSRYRIKKQSNNLLESKQEEINQKNRSLRQLLEEKESLLTNKDELLEEKEWLLKEIHHRVKNNLQIVSSLLNSQAAYLEDDIAISAIVDSQHRVRAMSLIHQKLYQSDKIATIAIEEYLKELVDNLSDSFSLHGRIRFQLEITPIELDVVIAVPLGLLINEAVTNCLKYAFPQNTEGVVYLSLSVIGSSDYLLTIADNGIGLVNASGLFPTRSLGMKLMKGLSKQLGGSLTLENTNGLKISVRFTPSLLVPSYAIQTR